MSNSTYNQLTANLELLKLTQMKLHLDEIRDFVTTNGLSFTEGLLKLSSYEVDFKEQNASRSMIKAAAFPFVKELKDYDELAEKWVREEIEEKYGPENADCEFSSADIFNIWDIYKADSDMSKISVKGIADKILEYTKMYYADNLVGKEAYGYRDMLIKCNRGIQN